VARRAGFAAVQFELNVGLGEQQARRAAVDHTANCGAVRFAEGGHSEKRTERVAGHGRRPNEMRGKRYYASPSGAKAAPCARL